MVLSRFPFRAFDLCLQLVDGRLTLFDVKCTAGVAAQQLRHLREAHSSNLSCAASASSCAL